MSPAGDLLRHHAELRNDAPGKASDPHFEPVEIGDLLDLLAEPAPHLGAGVACRYPVDVELLVEVVHQLHAAAEIHPGGLHAAVETERHGGAEGESAILAQIIVGRCAGTL